MESSSIMEAVSLSDEEPELTLESGPEQSNLVNGSEVENPPAFEKNFRKCGNFGSSREGREFDKFR